MEFGVIVHVSAMANAVMELLESSLETRLENTFHIKAKLSECTDKHRIAIVASLLYAYDQVRQLLYLTKSISN